MINWRIWKWNVMHTWYIEHEILFVWPVTIFYVHSVLCLVGGFYFCDGQHYHIVVFAIADQFVPTTFGDLGATFEKFESWGRIALDEHVTTCCLLYLNKTKYDFNYTQLIDNLLYKLKSISNQNQNKYLTFNGTIFFFNFYNSRWAWWSFSL